MHSDPTDPLPEAAAMPPAAVVTGAASGMGRAVAQRYLDEGWCVIGIDRDDVALAALADDYPGAFVAVPVDITDRSALETRLPPVLADRGVQVVVNAAGIYPPSTLADYDEVRYRRIFDVNVWGTLNVIGVTEPVMRAAGGGAVVNFASIDAFAVSPGQLLYSASKAAVVSLTKTLALELAPASITVNAVAPGWVDTPGTRAGGRMEIAAQGIPLGRVARSEEIADWVWQLGRGGYLTGETVVVAGGLVMR